MESDALEEFMNAEADLDTPVVYLDRLWWRQGMDQIPNTTTGPGGSV